MLSPERRHPRTALALGRDCAHQRCRTAFRYRVRVRPASKPKHTITCILVQVTNSPLAATFSPFARKMRKSGARCLSEVLMITLRSNLVGTFAGGTSANVPAPDLPRQGPPPAPSPSMPAPTSIHNSRTSPRARIRILPLKPRLVESMHEEEGRIGGTGSDDKTAWQRVDSTVWAANRAETRPARVRSKESK